MKASKPKKVWFIRHGESTANARGISSDPALISLTQAGFAQAEQIVGYFSVAPDLIITSPFVRTFETVGPLLKRYPETPCEEWPVHEFTYISPKRCTNTTMDDRKPLVEQYWQRNDPYYCDGDGAESFNDMFQRAKLCLSRLSQRNESFIAVFTHGQFMSAIKWIYDKNESNNSVYDVLAFRRYINMLAIKNGQKIELLL